MLIQRNCKYCGADITNKKQEALTCGSNKCLHKYNKEQKLHPKDRRCAICGVNINDLPGKRQICKNLECDKEQKRRKYQNKRFINICVVCGNEFHSNTTIRQCCSKECKKILRSKITTDTFNNRIIQQEVRCKQCDKLLYIQDKKNTQANPIFYSLCEKCKAENEKIRVENVRNRMLSDDNPTIKQYGRKPVYIPLTKEEISKRFSDRMKISNPMFNPDIAKKVGNIIHQKYKSGELKYKTGRNNPRNKASQTLYSYIRMGLHVWIRECLERDDFTCQHCKVRGSELHVHHLEPFIQILNRIKNELNITEPHSTIFDYDNELHNKLRLQIIQYHYEHPEIGISVCPNCHSLIDKKYNTYKKKKYENKKNRNSKK